MRRSTRLFTFLNPIANTKKMLSLAPLSLTVSSVVENSASGLTVGSLLGKTAGSTVTLLNDASGRFAISGNNILTGLVNIDYENAISYQITVREVLIGSPNSPRDTNITINVTDVVEAGDVTAPTITTTATHTTPENAVYTSTATANETVTWSKSGTDAGIVTLNTVTGLWSVPAQNYESKTSVVFTLTATDTSGNATPQNITLGITNVLESTLAALTLSANSMNEMATPGTIVGSLSGRTTGSTLSIFSDAGGRFALSGTNVVAGLTVTDREAFIAHSITIRETLADATNSPRDTVFNININDIDEVAPVITSASATSVAENAVLNFNLTANESVVWTKVGGADTALFTVTGSTLTMTAKDFEFPSDVDGNNTYIVTVRATDPRNNFTDQTITVTVTNVVEGVTVPAYQTINYNQQQTLNGRVYAVTSAENSWNIQRASNYGLTRFEVRNQDLRAGDPSDRERAELSGSPFAFSGNSEIWMHYAMMPVQLDQSWWNTLFQAFGLANGTNTIEGPVLKLEHNNNGTETEINIAGNIDNSVRAQIDFWRGTVFQTNSIYYITWKVSFHGTQGKVGLNINGVWLFDEINLPMGFGTNPLTYFKYGIYRDVQTGDQPTSIVIFSEPEYGTGTNALLSRTTNPTPMPYYSTINSQGAITGNLVYTPAAPSSSDIVPSYWVEAEAVGANASNSPVGTLNMTGGGVSYGAAFDQRLNTVAGIQKTITFTVTASSATLRIGTSVGDEQIMALTSYLPGTHTVNFTPTTTATWIRFNKQTAALSTVSAITSQNFGASASLANPSLGMGLNGVVDWTAEMPFIDIMKTARPWVGHLSGQYGGFDYEAQKAGGYLDANGWPLSMPPGVTGLETLFLTDIPEGSISANGTYRLRWEGTGQFVINSNGQSQTITSGNEAFFTVSVRPGALSSIQIQSIAAGNHLRNFTIIKQENIAAYDAGQIFNPIWINIVKDMRLVRFMDWQFINNSSITNWSQRTKVSDFTWTITGGIPVEIMIRLANEIGADPWLNVPHLATDAYITSFATLVRDTLDVKLKAHIEYSNEVWNWQFGQAQWAEQQGQARWGSSGKWVEYYGMRASQMADILTAVYGSQADARLVKVISTQTGYFGLEDPILNAPSWTAEPGNPAPPHTRFDAYAVTGYFGSRLGNDDAQLVLDWIAQNPATAQQRAIDALRNGTGLSNTEDTVLDLNTRQFPYHKAIADQYGLVLTMYEGGTHIVGISEMASNSTVLRDFYMALNYSSGMAQLYTELMNGWKAAGGTLFNIFVDVATPGRYGSWGALRHLDDSNPRYDAIKAWNAANPGWWESRAAGTFDPTSTVVITVPPTVPPVVPPPPTVPPTVPSAPNITAANWQMLQATGSTATNNPSGTLNLLGGGTGSGASADQRIDTVIGVQKSLTFTVSGSAVSLRIGTTVGNEEIMTLVSYVAGTYTVNFTPTTTTTWIRFNKQAPAQSIVTAISSINAPVVVAPMTAPWQRNLAASAWSSPIDVTVDVGSASSNRIISMMISLFAETTTVSARLAPTGVNTAFTLNYNGGTVPAAIAATQDTFVILTVPVPNTMAGTQTIRITAPASGNGDGSAMIHCRVLSGFSPTPIIAATYTETGQPARVALGTLPANSTIMGVSSIFDDNGDNAWTYSDATGVFTMRGEQLSHTGQIYSHNYIGVVEQTSRAGTWEVYVTGQNSWYHEHVVWAYVPDGSPVSPPPVTSPPASPPPVTTPPVVPPTVPPASPPPVAGQPLDINAKREMLIVGHSLADNPLTRIMDQISLLRNTDSSAHMHRILGSPLWFNYENAATAQGNEHGRFGDTSGNGVARLNAGGVNTLILTEGGPYLTLFRAHDTHLNVPRWMDAWDDSEYSSLETFLYQIWPATTNYPASPADWVTWRAGIVDTNDAYAYTARRLELQGRLIKLIPVDMAFRALSLAVEAGTVPGLTNMNQIFNQDDIHNNHLGFYFIAMCFYAAVYRATPVGLPINIDIGYGNTIAGLTQNIATRMQEIAWSIVSVHPYAGVATRPAAVDPWTATPLTSVIFTDSTGTSKDIVVDVGVARANRVIVLQMGNFDGSVGATAVFNPASTNTTCYTAFRVSATNNGRAAYTVPVPAGLSGNQVIRVTANWFNHVTVAHTVVTGINHIPEIAVGTNHMENIPKRSFVFASSQHQNAVYFNNTYTDDVDTAIEGQYYRTHTGYGECPALMPSLYSANDDSNIMLAFPALVP